MRSFSLRTQRLAKVNRISDQNWSAEAATVTYEPGGDRDHCEEKSEWVGLCGITQLTPKVFLGLLSTPSESSLNNLSTPYQEEVCSLWPRGIHPRRHQSGAGTQAHIRDQPSHAKRDFKVPSVMRDEWAVKMPPTLPPPPSLLPPDHPPLLLSALVPREAWPPVSYM